MIGNRKIRDLAVGLGLCLPFFALYTVFTIWPVLQGIYVSLHKWSLMGKVKFVGLENYFRFFTDQKFADALKHTMTFVALSVPLLVIMALILALLANRPVKIRRGLRIAYYLPSIISVSVASFIAKYMFAPYIGFLNGVLHLTGLLKTGQEIQWLNDTGHAWAVVTMMTVWWTVGFSMLLYLSALQDISPQICEAAEIDGATKGQQLFSIVLPLLKPTTYLIVMLQVIASFKVFGQIYLVTVGGPAGSTKPLIQYIYETGFKKNNMGYAAAMSYVLFVILIIFTLVQKWIQKKGEREDEA
ncbi:sugar ABC transporter permease [Lachnospiraceae bacterium 54-53]